MKMAASTAPMASAAIRRTMEGTLSGVLTIRQSGRDVGEPCLRVDIVELGGFNEGVDGRGAMAAIVDPAKVQFFRPTATQRRAQSGSVISESCSVILSVPRRARRLVRAQQGEQIRRIGLLSPFSANDPRAGQLLPPACKAYQMPRL
jgi:hypothetical protein